MAKASKILLAHGSGGRLSHDLVAKEFVPPWQNPILDQLNDSAVFSLSADGSGPRLAFTTDSYVVKPLSFKGGDIGRLAVCGTVNDLAMVGAKPLYLSASFVIEEGLPLSTLRAVVRSMREAAAEAGIQIVTGDTKVVERGAADGLFVNTAGVGLVPAGLEIGGDRARVGDAVILSGSIGDHGIAVLSQREGLEFEAAVESDVAPLNGLVAVMLAASPNVRVLRDPTRGGLATSLNEIAAQSNVGIAIEETTIPLNDSVWAACEMLGFDPLYVANEGKLVAVVAPEDAEQVLAAMRATRYGEQAAIIGEVVAEPAGKVLMRTAIGGTRIVHMLVGEMLPRIC
ncbi:MAG: hydrogenase expression/formation protein HypE [Chloroflexi bacterium RBG_16_64_32]|nr:MAG: hydrogenase expression/formation protein HypE [Chloroflexi bacterium RBG_16_64_32]